MAAGILLLAGIHHIYSHNASSTPLKRPLAQAHLPDSQAFRMSEFAPNLLTQGFTSWANALTCTFRKHEKLTQTTEEHPAVDNHLFHLWEACKGLTKHLKHQKHNCTLRKRIQDITQQAAEYASQLADSNWVDTCNTAANKVSHKST